MAHALEPMAYLEMKTLYLGTKLVQNQSLVYLNVRLADSTIYEPLHLICLSVQERCGILRCSY